MVEQPVRIQSGRRGPLVALYAYVVEFEDGSEGVLRRQTPIGTQPWVGDDAVFMAGVRELAMEAAAAMPGMRKLRLVRFDRAAETPPPPGREGTGGGGEANRPEGTPA